MCRCTTKGGRPCHRPVHQGSVFCYLHQRCQGSPMSGTEPAYQPDRYNGSKIVQETHNCWAYASDVLDPAQLTQCDGKGPKCQLLYHQPGGTKGRSGELRYEDARSCKKVSALMRDDIPDLRPSTFTRKCPRGSSKIALVMHPGEDYHFYRQDSDGWWSHKDGSNEVKRYDAEGQSIWNPQTAARDYRPRGSFLNYTDFCGFYCMPRNRALHLARGGSRLGNVKRPGSNERNRSSKHKFTRKRR